MNTEDQMERYEKVEWRYTQEDIPYLEEWLKHAEKLAQQLQSEAQKEGVLSIFTISATAKVRENYHPFLTPLRRVTHGFIGGCVVFSQTQAILLCKRIDGLVDKIFVDAEKKIGITIEIDENALRHFGLEHPKRFKARVHVEMGNLSVASAPHVQRSQFQEFKPNDMTVEAVWHFLSAWYRTLSGRRMAIIGSGNIGFKLALKLVESGCHVELVRRNLSRGTLMADAINITKPRSTIAIAHYNQDPLQSSLFCDAVIGCTSGVPAITWEMIQCMKPDGIVIDVGKGSVFEEAIEKAVQHGIKVIRCDVAAAIDGLIATAERNRLIMSKEVGRREIENGMFVVSGGCMGLVDDIVVDDYCNPRRIIGVADGAGDLKNDLSNKNRQNIFCLKELFSIS